MLRFLRRHSSLLIILSIGLVSGSLVWTLHGPAAFRRALGVAFDVFLTVLPALLAGLLLAIARDPEVIGWRADDPRFAAAE